MMGLPDLPQSKWGSGTGRQVILKGDFKKIEDAVIQSFAILAPPTIQWVDVTSIKVPATADDIAPVMMTGFPSQLHPGMFVSGGLTDGRYRVNTADVTLDFDLETSLWGKEKVSQWYIIYALAGNAATAFTLKAMPFMRVKSQAGQVISLGTLVTPATGIGYGFVGDELAGGAIYVMSGASKGLIRPITGNNNDNTTGGTITYGGDALTVAAGDWFVVLPPAANFRWIGDIFNRSDGNILKFVKQRNTIQIMESQSYVIGGGAGPKELVSLCSPLAKFITVKTEVGGAVRVGYPGITGDPFILIGGTWYPPTTWARVGVNLCLINSDDTANLTVLSYEL